MKTLFKVIFIFIALFFVIGYFSDDEGSTMIDDKRTYELSWREPYGDELGKISRLMVQKNISNCGEYHLKEIENGEYIIACTSDGENWNYYVAWPNIGEFYRANDEMVSKLSPPN